MKRSSNYSNLLQKLTGREDVKSFYFKEQKIALTINGWLKMNNINDYLPISESNYNVILVRLRYRLGNYRFAKDDSETFRDTYKENLSRAMKVFNREIRTRRNFNHVNGQLDLDKIRAILEFQALEPDNTFRPKVNQPYNITMVGNFNDYKQIPCIETRNLVMVGDTVSNKFSLGRVHGYTDVTRL